MISENIYKKGILIAVGELFLKSEGVRRLFLRKLLWNIKFFLKKEGLNFSFLQFRDRIFLETQQIPKASKILKNIFGISWFAESFYFPDYKKDFFNFIDKNYQKYIKKEETFAIRLRIGAGTKNIKRDEVIERIARNIKRKVNLDKPKKEIFVEIRQNSCFLYFKKKKGKGGLPVGSGGKALSLISGGIDSPVASYLIAKRGVEAVWVHFHSFPLVSDKSIKKVRELASNFLKYQAHLKIYFVPFQKVQIKVKTTIEPKYRVLLYRRLMFKIAERIAKKENCQALVTGESLGQVSSQTLTNLAITTKAVKIPIIRPLIGFDKEEIIKLAKKIKTFDISIKPQEDACTLFVPRHQTAKGDIKKIKEIEKKLDVPKLIREVLKEAEIENY